VDVDEDEEKRNYLGFKLTNVKYPLTCVCVCVCVCVYVRVYDIVISRLTLFLSLCISLCISAWVGVGLCVWPPMA
jgi:hypothetical protein